MIGPYVCNRVGIPFVKQLQDLPEMGDKRRVVTHCAIRFKECYQTGALMLRGTDQTDEPVHIYRQLFDFVLGNEAVEHLAARLTSQAKKARIIGGAELVPIKLVCTELPIIAGSRSQSAAGEDAVRPALECGHGHALNLAAGTLLPRPA